MSDKTELENDVVKELFPVSKIEGDDDVRQPSDGEGDDGVREHSDGEKEEDIDGDFEQDANISGDETDDEEMLGDDEEEDDGVGKETLSNDNVVQNKETGEKSDEDSYASDDDESDIDEPYEVKFHDNQKLDYIREHHIQEITEDFDEIMILSNVKRNGDGIIMDKKHTTTPIMTKYEKTRILGLRISQLNNGAPRLYIPENNIIDNSIIAEKELENKLLPFIISRPLPNGTKEHWRIQDLEII